MSLPTAQDVRSFLAGYVALTTTSTYVLTGNTTLNSAVVTNISTVNLEPYMYVSGSGIPVGTQILTVDSTSQITLTANATATATAVSLTFTYYTQVSDYWINQRITNFIYPYVQRITKQSFNGQQVVTEYYSGNGQSILILNRRPIVSLQQIFLVSYNDVEAKLGTSNIEVIQPEGILKSIGVFENYPYVSLFPLGLDNLKITYTYGYTDCPADVKEAIIYLASEQVLGFIGNRTGGGDPGGQGIVKSYGSRGKWTFQRNDMARQAHALLNHYNTSVVGQ